MDARKRIVVLSGGDSPERDVSLVSGRGVHGALRARGHLVKLAEIGDLDDLVPALRETDVVFSVLHGGSGEDGTVQRLLEVMGIPYVGSDAQSSARAMDKEVAKETFRLMGIPTAESRAFRGGDAAVFLATVHDELNAPWVVKPISAGSTLGVRVARSPEDLAEAFRACLKAFGDVLVEEYIAGRELTVGILDDAEGVMLLPVIEIRCPEGFFDYEAKYTDGVSEFLVPASLDEKVASSIQDVSLEAHRALGCSGYSRVDLRLAEDGTPYVLEVNTLPGMTPMSDLPRAAAAVGISYEDLVERMLRTALPDEGALS